MTAVGKTFDQHPDKPDEPDQPVRLTRHSSVDS